MDEKMKKELLEVRDLWIRTCINNWIINDFEGKFLKEIEGASVYIKRKMNLNY